MSIPRPRRPFSLFKRHKDGSQFYYVKFKNEETGKYYKIMSTKKTVWAEAEKVAWEWVNKGIPHKGEKTSLEFQSVLAYVSKLTDSEKRFWLKSYGK